MVYCAICTIISTIGVYPFPREIARSSANRALNVLLILSISNIAALVDQTNESGPLGDLGVGGSRGAVYCLFIDSRSKTELRRRFSRPV